MISVEAYRIIIGSFYLSCRSGFSDESRLGCSHKKERLKRMKASVSLFRMTLLLSLVQLMMVICGDVESNPGPTFSLRRAVTGTFHQGDLRFGETAGIQCACNALYSLCWSQIKSISKWKEVDLDYILTEGDKLYKSLNTVNLLSVDELPRSLVIYDTPINVTYTSLHTEFATSIEGDQFLQSIVHETGAGSEFTSLVLIGGYTLGLLKQGELFYIFDSHSRNQYGLSVPNGTSILLVFANLFEIEKYIQCAYLQAGADISNTYFQLQFLNVGIDNVMRTNFKQ